MRHTRWQSKTARVIKIQEEIQTACRRINRRSTPSIRSPQQIQSCFSMKRSDRFISRHPRCVWKEMTKNLCLIICFCTTLCYPVVMWPLIQYLVKWFLKCRPGLRHAKKIMILRSVHLPNWKRIKRFSVVGYNILMQWALARLVGHTQYDAQYAHCNGSMQLQTDII